MRTLVEEIFSNKLEREVRAGEYVWVELDKIMSHDTMTWLAAQVMKQITPQPKHPERIVVPFDHIVPPANIEQAKMQRNIMEFLDECGIDHFYQEGVCHQVMIDKGHVKPGEIIIGSDSHSCTYGALGAFGTGMGSTDIGVAYATGKTWFKVPETIKIEVNGKFRQGVYAKDLILRIIADLGVDGAIYKCLEFTGETISAMEVEERITLSNMAIECGAKTGLIGSDQKTVEYLSKNGVINIKQISASGGNYERTIEYDVSELEPQVACPHDLENLVGISEVAGTEIHQVFIGTCTNGRFSDLAIAAEILEGKRVNKYTRTIVTPASLDVFQQAMDAGIIKVLQDAGCIVCNPGCGPCLGRHQGVLAPGEVALTTMNRNFRGRMGSPEANIYLASPATCAASAIAGKMTDPRDIKGGQNNG